MIIDMILDRKYLEEIGKREYDAREFYHSMMEYGGSGFDIARAMDFGTEEDVKRELCKYIDGNKYNPEIKEYINKVDWITEVLL